MVYGMSNEQANSAVCSFFLRDRSMIRRACGDSYAEHDVYIDNQKNGRKRARVVCGGVRGDAKRRGGCGGVRGDALILWKNVMCWGGLRRKTFDFCA